MEEDSQRGRQPSVLSYEGLSRLTTQFEKIETPRLLRCPWFWQYQPTAHLIYKHTITEVTVAVLIGANFMTNILEATIDPQKNIYTDQFSGLELFYNIMFTIELAINMYSSWLWEFWKSGWNVFDFIVVSIGLMTTFNMPLPGPMKMLRMMRAFRVFRLFKRVEALKRILDSLFRAIPGVINALLILIIVMCIYAIIAVEVFIDYGSGGEFANERGHATELQTARGQDYGYEYFGNFPKSMYTMFQVLTGESWSEAVARPALHNDEVIVSVAVSLFYVSFVIINAIILVNVVVAVVIEKMVEPADGDGSEEEDTASMDAQTIKAVRDNLPPLTPEAELAQVRELSEEVVQIKSDMSFVKTQLSVVLKALEARTGMSGTAQEEPDPLAKSAPGKLPGTMDEETESIS